jgi:hypothetical protein
LSLNRLEGFVWPDPLHGLQIVGQGKYCTLEAAIVEFEQVRGFCLARSAAWTTDCGLWEIRLSRPLLSMNYEQAWVLFRLNPLPFVPVPVHYRLWAQRNTVTLRSGTVGVS